MGRGLWKWVARELCRLRRRWWVMSVSVVCGWWLMRCEVSAVELGRLEGARPLLPISSLRHNRSYLEGATCPQGLVASSHNIRLPPERIADSSTVSPSYNRARRSEPIGGGTAAGIERPERWREEVGKAGAAGVRSGGGRGVSGGWMWKEAHGERVGCGLSTLTGGQERWRSVMKPNDVLSACSRL